MNTEFRGEQLVGALNLMGSSTLIVDAPFVERILDVLPALTQVRRIVLHGVDDVPRHDTIEFVMLDGIEHGDPPARAAVTHDDIAMIQFTSGSTGTSKAVQLSHGYLTGGGECTNTALRLVPDDVLYCPFPLYHWDATVGTIMAVIAGKCTGALAPRFSVSRFWDDIRLFQATVFDFMGATLTFLYRVPEQPADTDNPVRLAWGVPMPDFKEDFERRFNLQLIDGYGSTEGGVFIFQNLDKTYPAGCSGEPLDGGRVRICDDDANELPPGDVGEILTKPDDPSHMMNGYLGMPDVNAKLIRDGWFHTGDLGRLDEHGYLYFAGRKKDVIRRRGENMSALEIETVVAEHFAVAEVAAYGVPSEYSEEEVAVAIVLRDDKALTQEDLIHHCNGKMARYMVPEHILFLDALPRTPTEKIAKAELRKRHTRIIARRKSA